MDKHKSLEILFICIGYLAGGLLFIPFTISAISSYYSGALNADSFIQLAAVMLVLVAIPITIAYSLWNGYKFGWWLTILFAVFSIFLYLITFASLHIILSTGGVVGNSAIGPLGYAIGYGLVYISTYLVATIYIILNISLIYFLTRAKTREYFGM